MVDRWIVVAFLWFYFALCLNGEENFRTFTTTGGKSFPFRVLSYEGQDFYFEDQSKKQYKVNYKQFSATDQKYLIEVATNGKIPKGDPRKMEVKEVAPTPESQNAGVSSSTQNATVQGERLKAPPKKKPKLRPGSFFAYQPVKLGQDPNLAIEKKQGGMPKTGSGKPRNNPNFFIFLSSFQNIFFYRICQAEPSTAFGLVSSTGSAKQIL